MTPEIVILLVIGMVAVAAAVIRFFPCKHEAVSFVRNVYGDEINFVNARSIWRCKGCGACVGRWELHKDGEGFAIPSKEGRRLVTEAQKALKTKMKGGAA